ncbi:hypothetical protein B484DRAFT_459568 [Ochromonadaceae sp. CCMP2298]|nr:hypothetical protein B484DRAFT_459568 [Ochromonadaceae sp. CCMP2298]
MSVNDRDIPLQPVHTAWSQTYVYFSASLLMVAFLPEVLQDSILDVVSGSVVDFSAILLFQFFSLSPLYFGLICLLVVLMATFYFADGDKHLARLWRSLLVNHRRVSPMDRLYLKELEVNGWGEDGSDDGKTVDLERHLPSKNAKKASFVDASSIKRQGMFANQLRVHLHEGGWRTITRRVTAVRGLRSLAEKNSKFRVEAPLDEEVLAYARRGEGGEGEGEDSSSSSSDSDVGDDGDGDGGIGAREKSASRMSVRSPPEWGIRLKPQAGLGSKDDVRQFTQPRAKGEQDAQGRQGTQERQERRGNQRTQERQGRQGRQGNPGTPGNQRTLRLSGAVETKERKTDESPYNPDRTFRGQGGQRGNYTYGFSHRSDDGTGIRDLDENP